MKLGAKCGSNVCSFGNNRRTDIYRNMSEWLYIRLWITLRQFIISMFHLIMDGQLIKAALASHFSYPSIFCLLQHLPKILVALDGRQGE